MNKLRRKETIESLSANVAGERYEPRCVVPHGPVELVRLFLVRRLREQSIVSVVHKRVTVSVCTNARNIAYVRNTHNPFMGRQDFTSAVKEVEQHR